MAKKIDLKEIVQDAFGASIQQVSGYDAAFLYAESPTSPMHVATLNIVEGSLEYADFKEIIISKLHLIPKFRQRLLSVPLNLDYPYWVDDPNFDIDLHLNRMRLPDPANWRTLRYLTSKLFSAPLDLRRPLWSVHFIEGLDEIAQVPKGSVAIFTKVHHVMIDGSSGVGIMSVLYDKDGNGKEKKRNKPKSFNPEPLPDELSLLLKSGIGFLKNPFRIPKTVAETAYSFIKSQATKKLSIQKEFSSAKFPVPITIFNGNISAKRTWGTALLSFDRVNALRKTMGGSFNDIILAICSGAIRRYLLEKEKLPVHPVVANVPISIRSENESTKMNNQIANMMIQIATHIEDPLERLEYIQEQTMLGKSRHNTLGAKTLSKMADVVPFGLANLIAGIYSKYNIKDLHRPPFNVTITNVPGPSNPLYLNGHKVVSIFGLTPVVDGFGLIIAAFSYNGQVSITTTSDSKTMPDADLFSRYIRESANELEELIQNLQKGSSKAKSFNKQVKSKSSLMFATLRKYLKANPKQVRAHKGIYYIEVGLGDTSEGWEVDLRKIPAVIKKKKDVNPKLLVEVEDESLYALYKGKLLLDELKIQGRIKLTGSETNKTKFLKLLNAFLDR
ncbi:WS/DGAT/MGAT family O-acyltransferase [Winogradskyella alexanderae]|uniref:diacylglycerol O-acyltransferase n=1 Tax=Winogradskyella alexanderae TaxID=2877123 RepID=A0ABS7XU36_9FLAO|nr:wax ester/triacylglycerol synthase family O-acyltransferase [Winogradskyella alexanderae]MCA0133540.1 wax ester/triacylglycerol synthase family O-acyltransferase [Winogradskyella alexanderae]